VHLLGSSATTENCADSHLSLCPNRAARDRREPAEDAAALVLDESHRVRMAITQPVKMDASETVATAPPQKSVFVPGKLGKRRRRGRKGGAGG
jgi:hypothetical protein